MSEVSDERRSLPSVEALLSHAGLGSLNEVVPRPLIRRAAREVLEEARAALRPGAGSRSAPPLDELVERTAASAWRLHRAGLRRVVNATGIVVHTNLGRSLLSTSAVEAVVDTASAYSSLEFDLEQGSRGSRLSALRDLLIELTGAEDALVVNNCAAAVLLTLAVCAAGRKVVVSRGELVEIGGSFRVPDIMARSGARLTEVGTTNKTHPADYERAVDQDTALLLKAHPSNFRMDGFVAEVELAELVEIGRRTGVPVVYDLGSGALQDLGEWGIDPEPTIQQALATGADLIMFSGDKLLGGPQCGILVGRRELVCRLAADPMARAVRLDKLTIAALEATLRAYLHGRATDELPTLRMLRASRESLRGDAQALAAAIAGAHPDWQVEVIECEARVGGGSQPAARVESLGVSIDPSSSISVSALARRLRRATIPVLGRIEADRLILDVRTLLPGDPDRIMTAFGAQEGVGDDR